MKEKFAKITAIMLSIMIITLSLLTLALPKREYSENENRYLASFPKLTWNSLISGKFVEGLESYVQDNFAFRDFFIESKAETELFLGKDENNGVYVTEDGYFISEYKQPSEEELKKRIDKINAFIAKLENVNAVFTLVPTSNAVNSDKLPSDRPDNNQEAVIEKVNGLIDATNVYLVDVLKSANKLTEQYFKTDHHWTADGAYTAYVALQSVLNYTASPLDSFEMKTVRDFFGTTYSKSGLYGAKGEDFKYYQNNSAVTVENVLSGVTSNTMYNEEYLAKKDKYSFYLNSNQPMLVIKNENAEKEGHLLVVKDSYANSLVPFLVENFKTVTVVDMRYYNGKLSEYALENSVTDLLILYNVDGFGTDMGINKLI